MDDGIQPDDEIAAKDAEIAGLKKYIKELANNRDEWSLKWKDLARKSATVSAWNPPEIPTVSKIIGIRIMVDSIPEEQRFCFARDIIQQIFRQCGWSEDKRSHDWP